MHRLQVSVVYLITVRNEVAKVIFLEACVCPRGGACLLQGDLVPGGVSGPRGVSARGGSASRGSLLWGCLLRGGLVLGGGCLLQGMSALGGLVLGGWGMSAPRRVGIPACTEADNPPPPWERRLLLRTVRILLECILVGLKSVFDLKFFELAARDMQKII